MKQYFIQNVDSGEPNFHCGSSVKEAITGIGYLLETDLMEMREGDTINFVIECKDMTKEEVEAIPEY